MPARSLGWPDWHLWQRGSYRASAACSLPTGPQGGPCDLRGQVEDIRPSRRYPFEASEKFPEIKGQRIYCSSFGDRYCSAPQK